MRRREWLASLIPFAGAFGQRPVHEEIREIADRAPLRLKFQGSTAGECVSWQGQFRAQLEKLLGNFAPPRQWETVVEEELDLPDHRRRALLLKADGVRPLPLYLLSPKPTRLGAGLLALHGHGTYGHDPVAGVASDEDRRRSIESANYDYGLQLVRQGYLVATPCFTPFGRRLGDRKAYGGDDPCAVEFVRMQMLGRLLIGENLRDALWAEEMLVWELGSDRIGCVGLSYGGRMTMLTSAFSKRIKVAVISGALNMMQERIQGRYSCGAQVIPGLLEYGDVPEIASLIAPRPCLWEVGQRDSLMVKEWIPRGLDRMKRSWRALGAEQDLQVDSFDGGHRWNGVKAHPLLRRVLAS